MSERIDGGESQRRPGALGVHSLDHFSLTVPDLAEAADFYTTFGLDVRAEGDSAGLYAFGSAHRWAVLEKGAQKKFGYLSFGIYEEDLAGFRDRLGRRNIPLVAPPAGRESNGIWFHDEEGNLVEVAIRPKSLPTEKSVFGEVPVPAGVAGAPPAAARRSCGRAGGTGGRVRRRGQADDRGAAATHRRCGPSRLRAGAAVDRQGIDARAAYLSKAGRRGKTRAACGSGGYAARLRGRDRVRPVGTEHSVLAVSRQTRDTGDRHPS